MTETGLTKSKGALLVILAGVLWSTVGVAVKSMDEANSFQILFYRSLSLTFYIGIISLVFYNNILFLIAKNFRSYFLGGLFLFCAYLGGIYSLQHTSAANALILFACAPIITAFLAVYILREIISVSTIVSIALALCGVLIMVWNDFGDASFKGNLAAIGSAFGFALFTINLRHNKNIEMLPSVFASGVIGVSITSFIIFMSGISFMIPKKDLLISLSMGVFQVGSGLVLYTIGSKVLGSTQLTILSLGEVFLGPLWVWIAIGEEIYLNTLIGGIIIFIAIFLSVHYEKN
tara:strand:- start:25 stop:894 length:870 start_codon:yes stop_codon:yes gene_type:complete